MSKEWEAVTRLGLRNVCKIPWSNSTKGKSDKRNHKSGTSNNMERIPSNGTRHLGVATWPFQRHSRSNHQATRKKKQNLQTDFPFYYFTYVGGISPSRPLAFSLWFQKATRRRKLVEERRLSKNSMGTFFFKSENLGKRRNACVQLFGGNSHGHLRLSFRMLEKVQTATHTAQRGNKTTKPIVPPVFYL